MANLLGGQVSLDDVLFAHVKGRVKNISLKKEIAALGLTISDNGAEMTFIKKIKEGTLMVGHEWWLCGCGHLCLNVWVHMC